MGRNGTLRAQMRDSCTRLQHGQGSAYTLRQICRAQPDTTGIRQGCEIPRSQTRRAGEHGG
eukprot:177336-Rhodomonas_salina.1